MNLLIKTPSFLLLTRPRHSLVCKSKFNLAFLPFSRDFMNSQDFLVHKYQLRWFLKRCNSKLRLLIRQLKSSKLWCSKARLCNIQSKIKCKIIWKDSSSCIWCRCKYNRAWLRQLSTPSINLIWPNNTNIGNLNNPRKS